MPWQRHLTDAPIEGTFRRQIDLKAWDEHTVVGWLEDEFHHFGVTLIHNGTHILDLRVAAPRHPWTTCPGAERPLRALIGQPLVSRCAAVIAMVDMQRNCTHLLDLASLVIAHAKSGRRHRRYHGTVQLLSHLKPDAPRNFLRATLHRDGQEVLTWNLNDYTIVAPEKMTGRGILHGFREWTDALDAEQAEDALVLRRVAFVAFGRRVNNTESQIAAELGQGPVCHTFQTEWSSIALRIGDTWRRYDQTPDAMLGSVDCKP